MTVIVTPWLRLKMVRDLFWPKTQQRFRCTKCGDRFRVEYRIGCFGPIDLKAEQSHSRFSLNSSESILCAHCGHDAWVHPDQEVLREVHALKLRIEDRLKHEVDALLRTDLELRRRVWAAQLTLDDFRRLDPTWFEALWENGPNPKPRMTLPRSATKKVRFYLRQVENRIGILPPLPPPDSGLQGACTEILRPDQEAFNTLLPRFESIKTKGRLIYGPLVMGLGHQAARPSICPVRGYTEGCYRREILEASQCSALLIDPVHAIKAERIESRLDRERLEDRLAWLLEMTFSPKE